MEIKEAVGILKGLQEPEVWEPQITEKTFEALDMAIIALEKFEDQSRFITIENNFLFCIVVDRVTGVMYAVSNGNNNAGTFTPLINADGKPLIYKKIIKESDLVKMGVIEAPRQPEIVHCGECAYYDPPHVENNGVRYEYTEMPEEAFDVLGTGLVNAEYGINVGGRCCRDYNAGYDDDKRVYVPENNYCGRAERRTDGEKQSD